MHPRKCAEGALQALCASCHKGISFTPTPSSLHSSIAGLTARFCQATHADDMEVDIKVSVAATRLGSSVRTKAVLEANYRCYNDELLTFEEGFLAFRKSLAGLIAAAISRFRRRPASF
jgi:hypothetical protein